VYTDFFLRPSVVAITLSAMLSACSSANVPVRDSSIAVENRIVGRFSTLERSVERPAADSAGASYSHTGPLLFVPNWSPSTVQVYAAKEKHPGPIATITDEIDSPEDACVDSTGSLYVANAPVTGSGWISVYAADQTKPSEVISEGINGPAACVIDAKGNLWVTNFNGANVTEYLNGTSIPHEIITSGLVTPNGIAIDHFGNLYVANGPSYSIRDNVQVYSLRSRSPERTITDGVTSPVGITVDANGTLYVTNINENNVEEYRAGKNRPFQTITVSMKSYPAGVTVNTKGRLYLSNYGSSVVDEFAPGSITPSKKEITKDLYTPSGPANSPPLLP
jgi:sugar lactone lactonase YvrE